MTRTRKKTLRKNRATSSEFPRDNLAALDETLNILGFDLPQWTCLLEVMGKSDNGWLQFMRGDLCVDFEKSVDIDELHLARAHDYFVFLKY